jgi:hypothetical protein
MKDKAKRKYVRRKAPIGTTVDLRVTKIRDGEYKWEVVTPPTDKVRLLLEEVRGSLAQRPLW